MTHFLLIIAILGWGLSGVLQKAALAKVAPAVLQMVSSISTLAVIAFYYIGHARSVKEVAFDAHGVFCAAMAGIVSTLGSIAFIYLMKSRDVSSIVGYAACYPLITFILACLFLGETFTTTRLIGICIVLVGISLLGK